jgi:exopolysaccharide biosynthesis protein
MINQLFLDLPKTKLLRYFVTLGLGLVFFSSLHFVSFAASDVNYQVYQQSNSTIHTVTIPARGNYIVTTEIAAELTPIESFATKNKAIAVINGGYFDPQNGKTTSYIIKNTTLVADPRTNERLIDNPDLQDYLGKILNRSEFRRYQCGATTRYDITLHDAVVPDNCILQDAVGAGPQLLPSDTSVTEGFMAYEDGKLIRDAIGANSPNARSAIAISDAGDVILAMVEQQQPIDSGMSLQDLASFLSSLGATKAINLDGGSSSSLYYQGKTYYGKLDKEGKKVPRPLKSVLLVR